MKEKTVGARLRRPSKGVWYLERRRVVHGDVVLVRAVPRPRRPDDQDAVGRRELLPGLEQSLAQRLAAEHALLLATVVDLVHARRNLRDDARPLQDHDPRTLHDHPLPVDRFDVEVRVYVREDVVGQRTLLGVPDLLRRDEEGVRIVLGVAHLDEAPGCRHALVHAAGWAGESVLTEFGQDLFRGHRFPPGVSFEKYRNATRFLHFCQWLSTLFSIVPVSL